MQKTNNIILNTKSEIKFHHSEIILLDICYLRKLILTLSKDNEIVLFNCETKNINLNKKYDEKINGIALHPTSLYLALSFSNKIGIYSIVLDELNSLFEIENLSKLKEITFFLIEFIKLLEI